MLKNAFDSFDREKKGSINPSMVGTILEMLGQTLDDKTLRKVQLEADEDGSGELDFDEFAALAAKYIDVEEEVDVPVKDLKEVFRFYDKEGEFSLHLIIAKFNDFLQRKGILVTRHFEGNLKGHR